MIASKLDDQQIIEMRETFQKLKLSLQKLSFKYNAGTQDLFVDAVGVEGIPQDDEYYENLEDNLMYTELTWLNVLCNTLNFSFEATIDVLPDGSFNNSAINLEINTAIVGNQLDKYGILSISNPIFKKLLPLRSFIHNVEFKGHEFCLRKMTFRLLLDSSKVNALINGKQPLNYQVLSQWTSTLEHILDYNQGRFKYITNLPIVNGRMSTASFESAVCFRFGGKRRGVKR
ncbi:hypothetical protein [Mesobacillus zeae]|uniref:hypothetical protein n=1 Tax=Mesobacillus zeae TaxID=1917180 RepID=UPI00300BE7C7